MLSIGVTPYIPKERRKISVPTAVKKERARVALEINDALEDWQADTVKTAKELGVRFGKKPEHFLSLFYGEEIKDAKRKTRALSLRGAWVWALRS